MRILTLFIVLCACLPFPGHAQQIRFTDTTNHWTFTGANYDGSYVCAYRRQLSYGADTVIYGAHFRPIEDVCVHLPSFSCGSYSIATANIWVREDTSANKIYGWSPMLDTAINTVLFDYNLQVGDTFTPPFSITGVYGWVPSAGSPDSVYRVDTVVINGYMHKLFTMKTTSQSAYGEYMYTFLQGVGSLGAFYPPFHRECINNIEFFGCFSNRGARPYFVAPLQSCSSGINTNWPNSDSTCAIATGIETIADKGDTWHIYPAPATDFLNIRSGGNMLQEYSIQLLDLLGRVVLTAVKTSSSGDMQLNVSGLANGQYLVRISGTIISRQQLIEIRH